MFKWIVKKLLGSAKKEIRKSIVESGTTRTVATASISSIAMCRALVYALAELGLIPDSLKEETALVLSAVIIPFVSRLLAIVRSKI